MTGNDYVRWLVVVPAMVVVGWLWWRFIGVGPVEWLLGWVTVAPNAGTPSGPVKTVVGLTAETSRQGLPMP